MANIAPTSLLNVDANGGEVMANNTDRVQWTLGQGDVGLPSKTPTFSDRAVQFSGPFGTASVTLEGTLNGTDYLPLTDPQGNAITKTVASIEAISENAWFIRPKVTGGDGTTAIVCTLLSRRENR